MPAAMRRYFSRLEPLLHRADIGRPRIGQYDINPFINSIYSETSRLESGIFL